MRSKSRHALCIIFAISVACALLIIWTKTRETSITYPKALSLSKKLASNKLNKNPFEQIRDSSEYEVFIFYWSMKGGYFISIKNNHLTFFKKQGFEYEGVNIDIKDNLPFFSQIRLIVQSLESKNQQLLTDLHISDAQTLAIWGNSDAEGNPLIIWRSNLQKINKELLDCIKSNLSSSENTVSPKSDSFKGMSDTYSRAEAGIINPIFQED